MTTTSSMSTSADFFHPPLRRDVLRLGSRGSRLARIQVEEFVRLWQEHVGEVPFEFHFLDTKGDRDRQTPLLGSVADDFFTDALDEALLKGEIDLAVHSAKDVPRRLRSGLVVAALTPAWDETDCLVARRGESLPAQPCIGTSSAARLEALQRYFPDWRPVPIRGNIEDRIRQVDEGRYDGAIIATCALKRLGLEDRISQIMPWEAVPLQSQLAVVVREDDWPLRLLLRRMDCRRTYGKVVLVGAGCGDPSWLTLQALEELKEAEVVFYDYLIPEAVLNHLRPETRREFVGKRKGAHTLPQEELNRRLRDEARSGRRVVRLKGGDPLIFGRGWEELDYLMAYHIPVGVVPGISAGTGLVSQLGVPLTHRSVASSVGFVTAHGRTQDNSPAFFVKGTENEAVDSDRLGVDAAQKIVGTKETVFQTQMKETADVLPEPKLKAANDAAVLKVPDTDTLVVFMGLTRLSEIVSALKRQGRPGNWPVLLISQGATPFETVVCGTLDTIEKKVAEAGVQPPALIVAGTVVEIARSLIERPKILYTGWGKPHEDWEWIGRLVSFPLFRIEPVPIPDDILRDAKRRRWNVLVFTSRHAVVSFLGAWRDLFGREGDGVLNRYRIAAIGNATARALDSFGIKEYMMPQQEDSEGLFKAMKQAMVLHRARVLHPRSDQPNPVLKNLLQAEGAVVDELTAYRNIRVCYKDRPHDPAIRGIFFTSPSAVSSWHEQFDQVPESWWVFARGRRTYETMRSLSYPPERIVVLQRIPD